MVINYSMQVLQSVGGKWSLKAGCPTPNELTASTTSWGGTLNSRSGMTRNSKSVTITLLSGNLMVKLLSCTLKKGLQGIVCLGVVIHLRKLRRSPDELGKR